MYIYPFENLNCTKFAWGKTYIEVYWLLIVDTKLNCWLPLCWICSSLGSFSSSVSVHKLNMALCGDNTPISELLTSAVQRHDSNTDIWKKTAECSFNEYLTMCITAVPSTSIYLISKVTPPLWLWWEMMRHYIPPCPCQAAIIKGSGLQPPTTHTKCPLAVRKILFLIATQQVWKHPLWINPLFSCFILKRFTTIKCHEMTQKSHYHYIFSVKSELLVLPHLHYEFCIKPVTFPAHRGVLN